MSAPGTTGSDTATRRTLSPMQEKVLRSLPREYGFWWAPIGWLRTYGLIEMAEDRTPAGQRPIQRAVFRPSPAGEAWLAGDA